MADLAGRMILGGGLNIPGPQPITRARASCLINAYQARAAMLRSKLSGDALAETRLNTAQRVKLQEALTEKGFLSSDQAHDGEFGPTTRKAIKQFQESLGAFSSGFLTSDQRLALRPEEREANIARASPQDAQIAERRTADAAASPSSAAPEKNWFKNFVDASGGCANIHTLRRIGSALMCSEAT